MSVKRIIDTKFWEDEKVLEQYSPEDKYFYLYLLTNPRTTLLGVYRFVPKQAAFEMGYSIDTVMTLLDRFENKYKTIRYNRDTSEIAIRNYLRYGIVSGGRPILDTLLRAANEVVDKSLVEYVRLGASGRGRNATVTEFFKRYASPSPIPLTPLSDTDNDYDYDYGVSPTDSPSESPSDSLPRSPVVLPGARTLTGTYHNVLLSPGEIERLMAAYPDWRQRIDRLSEYMESKGAKYKNHYATIVAWAKQDAVKAVPDTDVKWAVGGQDGH